MRNVMFLAVAAAVLGGACGGESSVQAPNEPTTDQCEVASDCDQCPQGAEVSCESGWCYCNTTEVVEVPTCKTATNCPLCDEGADASCKEGVCYCDKIVTVEVPVADCVTNADCTANCGVDGLYEPLCQAGGVCFCRERQRECYSIKRGEFAFRLMRELVDLSDYPAPSSPTFTDVPPTHEYYVAIEAAVDYGILDGYPPDGEYRPDNLVNRAEGSKASCEALSLIDGFSPPDTPTFSDTPTDAWYYIYVEGLVARNLTRGYVDSEGNPLGLFGPADAASSCFLNEIMVEADFIAF